MKCISLQRSHIRRIRKSLDDGSAATLVHAFVTYRVDYCNAIYAGASKTITDKLQRVLSAAARVVSDTWKFDRGLTSLHDELHWLEVPEREGYLQDGCHGVPLSLRSGTLVPRRPSHHILRRRIWASVYVPQTDTSLSVPRCRLNTYGRRAFSVAGPTVWNSLPDDLRDPVCGSDSFKQFLKTILFSLY